MRETISTPPYCGALPFRVLMSGISYCDGSYVIRRNASPLTCIEYVIQGEGTVHEDGRTFTAREGDIYILHEGRNHYYYSDDKNPWIKIWMNLSGPAVEHLLSAYGLQMVNHISGLNLKEDFQEFYTVTSECRSGNEISTNGAILFHKILQKISAYRADMATSYTETARKIKDTIDAAERFEVSLDDIANTLHFTKTHLIRTFRQSYKMTPYEYILAQKLRLATDLLTNTNLPISEIATYLNFCDAHYFTNFFRARVGVSPREYRKQKTLKS